MPTNFKAPTASVLPSQPDKNKDDIKMEMYIEGFRSVRNVLAMYMDPENGLLVCLITHGIMNDEDYRRLNRDRPYEEINDDLIVNFIAPKIETHGKEFVDALVENNQDHIAKFIMSCGNNLDSEDRVLNDKELNLINNNMFCLVNLISPYRMEFLYRLVAKRCISDRQKGRIECRKELSMKVDELLTIMKRRRLRDFRNFKICLHDTMQNRIVEILERGGVVTVRIKLNAREDKQIIESKLIKLVTGYVDEEHEIDKTLTQEQVAVIKDLLKELEKLDIHLIGNAAWHSMAMFFMCEGSDSFKAFVRLSETGRLKEILETMYRCLLGLSDEKTRLIKTVSIVNHSERTDYTEENANRTIRKFSPIFRGYLVIMIPHIQKTIQNAIRFKLNIAIQMKVAMDAPGAQGTNYRPTQDERPRQ